jgi:hypothetical protein
MVLPMTYFHFFEKKSNGNKMDQGDLTAKTPSALRTTKNKIN